MALPTPAKLRERMRKTAAPSGKVMGSWSNYRSKQHYNRCSEQVIDRLLIDRGEAALAWDVVLAVCLNWMNPDRGESTVRPGDRGPRNRGLPRVRR